jgi:hypothetical protein
MVLWPKIKKLYLAFGHWTHILFNSPHIHLNGRWNQRNIAAKLKIFNSILKSQIGCGLIRLKTYKWLWKHLCSMPWITSISIWKLQNLTYLDLDIHFFAGLRIFDRYSGQWVESHNIIFKQKLYYINKIIDDIY